MKRDWLKKAAVWAAIGGIMFLFGCNKKSFYDSEGKLKRDVTVEDLQTIEDTHGDLLSAEYYTGGGMNGEHYSVMISRQKDGNVIIETKSSSFHNIPLRVYRYQASEEDLKELKKYSDQYHLPVWKDFPFDDTMIVMDGPSTGIALAFDDSSAGGRNYSFYRISYENVVPEGGYQILNGFRDLLSSKVSGEWTDTFILLDGQEVRSGRDIENSDEEVKALMTGVWKSTKKVEWNALTGETTETLYDADVFYYLDYPRGDGEFEFFPVGMTEGRSIFRLDSIVHEALADRDSSWFAEFKKTEVEEPVTAVITVVEDELYMDLSYDLQDSADRVFIVFKRND